MNVKSSWLRNSWKSILSLLNTKMSPLPWCPCQFAGSTINSPDVSPVGVGRIKVDIKSWVACRWVSRFISDDPHWIRLPADFSALFQIVRSRAENPNRCKGYLGYAYNDHRNFVAQARCCQLSPDPRAHAPLCVTAKERCGSCRIKAADGPSR